MQQPLGSSGMLCVVVADGPFRISLKQTLDVDLNMIIFSAVRCPWCDAEALRGGSSQYLAGEAVSEKSRFY